MVKVLIVGEFIGGQLKRSVGELAGAAGIMGGELHGALLGPGSAAVCPSLGRYGVAQAFALDGGVPAYSSDGYPAALAELVRAHGYDYVLLMQSQFGRDLGARLSARLGGGWLNDVTGLEVTSDGVVATKPLYAGKVISKQRFTGSGPNVITLRPKIFTPVEPHEGCVSAEAIAPPAACMSQVVGLVPKEAGQIDLKEADIIITGGRGVGGPEGFAPLREFAKAVGCALGSSRAAVDAGWIPHSHQVGQTGKVVNPQLYIACGVSGAIQHLAGMQTSKYIVAINSNENAPIFKIADYGIIADLFEAVPELQRQILALRE
jgi:electron transfer flavoprotein alpha subunit